MWRVAWDSNIYKANLKQYFANSLKLQHEHIDILTLLVPVSFSLTYQNLCYILLLTEVLFFNYLQFILVDVNNVLSTSFVMNEERTHCRASC